MMWVLVLVVVVLGLIAAWSVDRRRKRAGLTAKRWGQHDQWSSGSGGGSP